MIYNNLFKVNKSSASKNALYYLVESRKYKFSFIFDKKSVSILSALSIGTVIILGSNLLFYGILSLNNSKKIVELSTYNSQYESSVSQLTSMQDSLNETKKSADVIYNLSEKSTKWSNIIESIAAQLPYDSVLTGIASISQEQLSEIEEEMASDDNGFQEEDSENNMVDEDLYYDDESTEEYDDESTEEYDEDGNLIESNKNDLNDKNMVLITGKSLSMVNMSLFLDKLDGLHIFSKVENLTSVKLDDQDFYEFVIYATLR